ncbi:MAG: c-type cytochrome, partial [Chrysiogenetes bacterium]|nr:c-type cytochrome [Chrysiogenetes bacterium]
KSLDVEHAFFYEEALKKEKTLEEQAARGEATELEVSNAKAESEHFRSKLAEDAANIAGAEENLDNLRTELKELQAHRDEILAEYTKWDELKKTATRELAVMQDKLRRLERPWFMPEALWYEGTIQQVVLRGYRVNAFDENQYTVDRCMTCHMGVDKSGFESEDIPLVSRTHPDRGGIIAQHPIKKFACTPCHMGQGPAVSSTTAAEHSDLDEVHGLIHHWNEPVLGFVQSGHYHEYKEERETDYTQASCFKCHSKQYEIESPHADVLNAGKEYVTKLGCWGCHNVKNVGDQALGATGKKVGPSLTRVMEKVSADWIVSWVENPQAHLEHSRMPYYADFSRKDPAEYQEDLHSLAAFLNSRSKDWPELDADTRSDSFFTSGSAKRGEELFKSVGCMGCHALGERPENFASNDNPFYKDYDVAPNLYNTGNKIRSAKWVYHWIKNPSSYDPNTSMPSLRLTDAEALDITTYLMQQKGKDIPQVEGLADQLDDEKLIERGEWIVSNYGCFGCHNITGFEKTGKISVELSEFANKTAHELAFGITSEEDVPRTWEAWTINKLQNPRGYETERQLNKMPDFKFSDEAAHAIRVFLKSQTGQKVGADWFYDLSPAENAEEEGRVLVEQFNCKACHGIDGKGGRIMAYFEGEDPNTAPPQLNRQGERVQPDWFYHFLQKVEPIRPWLKVRMPSFNIDEEEATKIVQYFQGKTGDLDPFVRIELADIDPANVERGRELFTQSGCSNCHFTKQTGL